MYYECRQGPLIDEESLISSLNNGKIFGAGFDVLKVEPLPSTSKLLGFDNVILGSDNANHLAAATEYEHKNTIKNLFEALCV
ncbi:MAG: hypothetical protein HRU06_12865 [Oceanospirillaceae bacterium]|nr:hypothetical protein [Colwellia sp.]NQZ32158.1 hypothetical protein [Oceanospirillaceae bacterium]